MGGIFVGGDAPTFVAAPAVALAVVVGTALFLAAQWRRYGRIAGWPGQVTLLVLLTGVGLVAYAVWPLPRGADGLCAIDGGAPPRPDLSGTLRPWGPAAAAHAALAFGALVPVGVLARYRYRRGPAFTLGLGVLVAFLVEMLQVTGLAGLYPCPYRVGAVDDIALGGAGVLVGWLVGTVLVRLLPRAWPAAVADLMPPGIARRALGHAVDLGLWWYGAATAAAALAAAGVVAPDRVATAQATALVVLAVVAGLVPPALRGDLCAPGRAAARLALSGRGRPGAAPRWRALLRAALLYGPVTALVVLGWGWWSLAVLALHGFPAVVRRDQAGLFDLLAGTRVVTRATLSGALPSRQIRYTPPQPADTPAPTSP